MSNENSNKDEPTGEKIAPKPVYRPNPDVKGPKNVIVEGDNGLPPKGLRA